MATVYVNDKPVDIGNERLNCVQAAERAGVLIPHYCYHPALTVVASCRMCLVEIGELKDGKVLIPPKVFPGCQTPVKDNTVIVTGDYAKRDASVPALAYPDKYVPGKIAHKAQADTLEGILLNHPLDCPVCDKAGECKLQDYSFEFGRAETRMVDDKNTPPNKPDLGPKIALFTDRCVMCSRCVRFTREISGEAELQVINRGHHAEIDVFPGEPLDNKLAGNVVDLCPVGALGSKDFLYTQRVWYLKSADSVCAGCSTGCSIHVDTNKDVLFRLRPRENPQSQGYFMCDEGRYGYHYVNSKERLDRPLLKQDGKAMPTNWSSVISSLASEFNAAVQRDAAGTWLILSPFLTCEEAYLAAKWFKGLSKDVKLALGHVPLVGEDDTYPKDRRGNAIQPVKFTIRSEKCPNRRGVEEILKHFQGEVFSFTRALDAGKSGSAKAVFLTAGYPDPTTIGKLGDLPVLAASDLFPGEATRSAKFILPAAAFAEKDGTFINHAGLAQAIKRCVKPPRETRAEAQVFFELLGRRGLVNVDEICKEMAAEVSYFAGLANGIGELGTKLA